VAAAAGPIGGAVIGGAISYGLQKDSQSFQKQVLQNQKQWLVADLRAAGLNPILAAGGLGGQVSGGGGIASPSSAGDIGEAIRRGGLFKAAKAKAAADAVSAKNISDQTMWNARTAEHTSTIASDEAIIKQNERVQSNARQKNVLMGIESRTQLDRAGISIPGPGGGFKLTGAELRKLNVIIQQLRGRDNNTAKGNQ